MDTVHIPRPLVNHLLHLAQESPECEVCGLISAREGIAEQFHPVRNVADDPARHFLLDAGEQIAVLRTLRERGETLFGIFHSHPDAPALPSAEDTGMAAYPDALYFIASLGTKGVLELRGFRLEEKTSRFEEVNLRLGDV
jgi:proteasome lid subunit RPN8/RPN11